MNQRAPRARWALALLLSVLTLSAAGGGEGEVERWIQALRSGTPAERVAAMEALAGLGESARPALERALQDPDPDLRFHALYLLRAPESGLERSLRRVTFGRPGQPGASYPASLEAYERLIARATPALRAQLLRVSLRSAPLDQPQLLIVALSTWTELSRAQEISAGEAQLLGELLTLDLGEASDDLLEALAALPVPLRIETLQDALRSDDPLTKARAARALGETTSPEGAAPARQLLLPLLGHGEAVVRRQAIYALGLLGPPAPLAAAQLAEACRDPDAECARIALRLAGEWRVRAAREALEETGRDSNRPERTRAEAIRSLGLLGDPAAIAALRRLAGGQGELSALAAWSLALLRAPGTDQSLLARIQSEQEAGSALLYRALARLGSRGRPHLRALALFEGPFPRGPELELIRTRTQHALDAYAYLDDPAGGEDLAELIRRAPQQFTPAVRGERLRAAEALATRRDPTSIRLVAELLIRPGPVGAEQELLKGLIQHGAPPALEQEVARVLVGMTLRAREISPARALARVDPELTRRVLTPMVRGRVQSREQHDLAHILARVGERGLLTSDALPFALRQLGPENGEEQSRLVWLILAGLDHFYAGRLAEARLAFLRVHWTRPHWYFDTPAYDLGCVATAEGKFTDAFRLLRRAVRHGYKRPELSRYDLDLIPLRTDPRFQEMVDQLELAAETGLAPPVLALP